ncbi:MAG: LysR family transcriptional regulator [Streptomycetaceae bacterium]|nr:LysR family transcriptional regulator [Streptomycetaceae bacterium]
MTLQQLRYLVAIADHGTMTAAAEALYVAQSALSRALKALEHELGAELLVRDGRTVRLSGEGKRVVRLARTVLETVGAIEDVGRAAVAARTHGVRVATTPTLAVDLTGRVIPAFEGLAPEVAVDVARCGDREGVFDAVRTGDAALGLVDVPVPDDLRAHPVADHEVVLVSPPSEDLPDPLPLDALDGIRLALPTRGSGRRCEMEAMFAALWVRPVPAVESDDRVHWIASVLNGEGSMLWYRTIAEAVFGEAAAIRSFSPPLVRSVALVHASAEPSGAARTFLEFARLAGIDDDT